MKPKLTVEKSRERGNEKKGMVNNEFMKKSL